MLKDKQKKELFQKAREAVKHSYSPYSHFPVGAAVLTKNKEVYLGTNVENVLFGLTICAERSALCNAVSNGAKDIEAVAVYSSRGDISPCGVCRLFIYEFGENIEVIYSKNDQLTSDLINNLIPKAIPEKEQR